MTVDIATLGIRIDSTDARTASRDLNAFSQAGARAEQSSAALTDVTRKLQAALALVGVGTGVGAIIKMADEYTKLTAQLRLASNSHREYAASYEEVKRIANSAQQDLAATATLYARIANGTRELGTTQKQVAGITETVNLALKVSGASAAESASAQLQLAQAFATGTLRGEEFNAVNESAPRLMKALADGMGVSTGALRSMSQEGAITAQVMADVLPKALDQLRDESKQVQTIAGAFTVLKNNVMEFTGVQAQASGTVTVLAGGVGLLANNLGILAGVVGTLVAAKLAVTLSSWVSSVYNNIAANNALLASNVATARSDFAAAAAADAVAAARVIELRAAVLAAEGNVALAITTNGLIPAEANAARTAAALATANTALAAASTSASIATRALNGALALTGGPVGLIVTVLGVAATAWTWYASKAEEANKAAAGSTEASTGEIISNIQKQNEKLRERLELAKLVGQTDVAKAGGAEAERLASLLKQINDLKAKGNALTAAEQVQVITLQGFYNDLAGEVTARKGLQAAIQATGSAATDLVEVRERLAGVNKQYFDDLKKLEAALKAGAVGEKEYIDLVSQLATETYKKSEAGKASTATMNKEAEAVKKAAEEYKKLIDRINGKDTGQDADFQQNIALLKKGYDVGKQSLAEYIATVEAYIKQQPASIKLEQEHAKAIEESNKRAQQGAAEFEKLHKSRADAAQKAIEQAEQEAARNEELVATFGMEKSAIEALEVARLQEQLAQRASIGMTLDEITETEKLIAAKQRSAASLAQFEELTKQKQFWIDIDKTAHDTFVSIMDGSKSAAQRLRDTFKNVFFDWLYSMTLKKWIVNLQGQFSTSGAGAVASLAGGGDSGGIGGLLSVAKTGYTALSNGISGMAGMFSEGLHQFGATITSNVAALGEWMGGSVGEMLGSNALAIGNAGIWAGGIGAGLGAGKLISNGYSVAGNSGNGAVMIGTALGAIWGPLGSALGGAIGGLVNRAFGMGAKEVTGSTITGNLGATGFDGKLIDVWTQKGGWFRSDKQGTTDRAVDAAMATGLGDAYAKITAASRDYAKALGVDADYITGRSQSLSIALTKDAAANEKAITDFFTGVANTVAGELVPGITQFSKEGEAASATLQRLAVQYTAVDAILKSMGASGESAFGVVGVASLAARERLLTLTGGIDALASQTSFFAQNFLTEAERLKPVQDQVTAKMAELGFASVTTNDAFKNVVVGLQTSGALANEVGANAYAELLKIAPLFKVVADANAAAAQAQAEAAQAQAEAAKKALEDAATIAQKLADINKPYQDRIAELQVELGYASAARATELAVMDASTRSLYEHEQGLLAEKAARDKRNAEYDAYVAKAAQDEQARQAQAAAIAQQRAAMEIQLYNLTHTAAEQVAAARERELALIDPVLKGLQQQIYAQQDLADAAAIAAKAIEDAAARAKAISSERAGIERSILQLQGNTAELRKLELAALDPANRALQESYFALQDKMAAEQAAAAQAQAIAQAQAQAAEEARRAEEALKAARQSATDSIFDEVKRIRGLIDGGGATSLAGAQSAFAIATAQARAGDLDAMKTLPGLSKSLLDLVQANAVTAFDLQLARAQTAASLTQTGQIASKQYGVALPSFDVGTDYISRTGLALVHEGERITPAASNKPFSGSGGNADLVAEIRQLREDNKDMAKQLNAALYAIAKYTQTTADHVDTWNSSGLPEERTAVSA